MARGQHYFAERPDVAGRESTVHIQLPDLALDLRTDAGVFSHGRLDPGTKVLLERAPGPPDSGELLDLGCGYGPIALTLAHRSESARVWAVDVNERALELVRDNAAAVPTDRVCPRRPDQMPDEIRFDAIYTNPPIRVGKAELHRILLTWLPLLRPEGVAYLVVQKNLGADSLAGWLTEQGYPTTRLASRNGYRLLDVRADGSTPV